MENTSKKFERLGMKITLADGVAEVVHYKDARTVTIQFENGDEVTTTWQNIIAGRVRAKSIPRGMNATAEKLHSEYRRLLRNGVKIWKSEQEFLEWACDKLPENDLPRIKYWQGRYIIVPSSLELNPTLKLVMNGDVKKASELHSKMLEEVAELEKKLAGKHLKEFREHIVKENFEFINGFFDLML